MYRPYWRLATLASAVIYVSECAKRVNKDIRKKKSLLEVTHQTQGPQQIVRLQLPGPRSQCIGCFSTQHLQSFNRHGQHGDEDVVNRHHITASTSPTTASGRFSFDAGQGPVHTDENHAVIIPRAKPGDNIYSLLQLSDVRGGGIRTERLTDIQK